MGKTCCSSKDNDGLTRNKMKKQNKLPIYNADKIDLEDSSR